MEAAVAIVAISVVLVIVVMANQPKARDVSALPRPSEDVKRLIEQGRKVAAIRAYRRQTGASLLEAYRVVGRHAV